LFDGLCVPRGVVEYACEEELWWGKKGVSSLTTHDDSGIIVTISLNKFKIKQATDGVTPVRFFYNLESQLFIQSDDQDELIFGELFLLGFLNDVQAAREQKPLVSTVRVAEVNSQRQSDQELTDTKPIRIQFKVIDSLNHQPVPFAAVMLSSLDTILNAVVDEYRMIVFCLPQNLRTDSLSLLIHSIGYTRFQKRYSINELVQTKEIIIVMSGQILLGELVVTDSLPMKKKKWWQRSRKVRYLEWEIQFSAYPRFMIGTVLVDGFSFSHQYLYLKSSLCKTVTILRIWNRYQELVF
jgi:hypothetical protein